ncbi:MAG: NAD(P)/FAD-dependent oxidoreductase [Clostridia bacterium]|nr:NAD(P)/FAD-dependent oxidoreductase [Clostridia bacterium]
MLYDVLIIGAGITGAMTARKLAKYQLSVCVAEAAGDVAMGATKANSAIVHAGFDAECGTLKAKLNVQGCAMMKDEIKELDVPYKNNGSLVCAFSDEEVKHLEKLKARGDTNGVPDLEIIDGKRLHEMEPNVSPDAIAALWAPSAGIVCPYELCIAACENANVNGVDFRFNFRVVSIEKKDGVFFVSDGKDTIEAKYVVNASGVHSDEIAKIAGDEIDFAVIPRRGEYMLLDRAEGKQASATLFACPSANGKGILVSPTVDGNLILGPTAKAIDDKDDTATTQAGLDEVIRGALHLMPKVNTRAVITQFSGVRPTPVGADGDITKSDFCIRISEKVPGLLHLAGIESPGLASSPAVGAYAVELLEKMGLSLNEKPDYKPGRPEKIRFRELNAEQRAEVIKKNPLYGKIICRCETVTEGEIVDAIRRPLGARDLDMVKRRTRAGMGRCGSGFCSPRTVEILARELGVSMAEITKCGGDSVILNGGAR